MADEPAIAVAASDAPSVDEQAAGQASAAAGGAAVLAGQAEQSAAQAAEAAGVAAAAAAQTEGAEGAAGSAAESAARAEAAAASAEGQADRLTAAMDRLADMLDGRQQPAVPPEPVSEPEDKPDRAPAKPVHWSQRRIGRKRS